MIFIVSDLLRHDSLKLNKSLEAAFPDRELLAQAKKSYSQSYKIMKVMAFSEAAKKALDFKPGSIVAILNPKKLESQRDDNLATIQQKVPTKKKEQVTYCIDNENSVVYLGYSQHYGVCDGKTEHPATKIMYPCRHFVNSSIEKACERHQYELQQR